MPQLRYSHNSLDCMVRTPWKTANVLAFLVSDRVALHHTSVYRCLYICAAGAPSTNMDVRKRNERVLYLSHRTIVMIRAMQAKNTGHEKPQPTKNRSSNILPMQREIRVGVHRRWWKFQFYHRTRQNFRALEIDKIDLFVVVAQSFVVGAVLVDKGKNENRLKCKINSKMAWGWGNGCYRRSRFPLHWNKREIFNRQP